MKSSDFEKISRFAFQLHHLYQSCTDMCSYRQNVLFLLEDLFGYKRSVLVLFDNKDDPKPGTLEDNVFHNISKRFIHEYYKTYYKLEIVNFHPEKKSIICIDDIMPYDQYEKTEFYQQFLKRYDIYYRVTIPLNIDKDYSGALELYRSKEEGSFSNDMEMIDQLKNYIEIGLCNMRDILNLRDDVQKYRIYFDQIQIGTAIVDDQYQLVKCNKIFRDLLLSYDHDVNFKIFFINNLLNKIKDNYLLGSRITDIWVNGILFRVSLQGTSNYFSPNQYHIVAIRTKDEAERGELSELLSNREIEIVNCISKGYKNDQIAKELFLSVHTVKTHIQNMFKKFNVSNRISLLNRIRDIK